MRPTVETWNLRYGGKYPSVSNVIYTNGEEDPWKWASILPQQTTNTKIYPIEMKCDNCAHCIDLHAAQTSDPQEVKDARNQIRDIIKGWIAAEKVAIANQIPVEKRDKYISEMK